MVITLATRKYEHCSLNLLVKPALCNCDVPGLGCSLNRTFCIPFVELQKWSEIIERNSSHKNEMLSNSKFRLSL